MSLSYIKFLIKLHVALLKKSVRELLNTPFIVGPTVMAKFKKTGIIDNRKLSELVIWYEIKFTQDYR